LLSPGREEGEGKGKPHRKTPTNFRLALFGGLILKGEEEEFVRAYKKPLAFNSCKGKEKKGRGEEEKSQRAGGERGGKYSMLHSDEGKEDGPPFPRFAPFRLERG